MLSVRDADAARFRSLADLRGKTRRHARRDDRLRDPAARRARARPARRLVRRRRASVQRPGDRPRRRGAARQRARRAPSSRDARVHDPAGDGRDRPLRRRRSRRRTRRCATASTRSCAARCATARSSASSGSGRSGTTISRSSTRGCSPAKPVPAVVGLDTSASVATVSQMGSGAALSAVAAARVGRHHRAVVPVDGAGGRRSAC